MTEPTAPPKTPRKKRPSELAAQLAKHAAREPIWQPKRGMPLALTQDIGEKILNAINIGVPAETAVKATGLHRDTYYGWMQRGRKGEEPYASFLAAVERAKGQAEMRMAMDMSEIANGTKEATQTRFNALGWFLERTNPAQWARPERDAVTVNVGVTLEQVLPTRYAASLANEDNMRQLTEGEIVPDEPPPAAAPPIENVGDSTTH